MTRNGTDAYAQLEHRVIDLENALAVIAGILRDQVQPELHQLTGNVEALAHELQRARERTDT